MIKNFLSKIENCITKEPERVIWFITKASPEIIEKVAEKKLLKGFHYVATHVEAYKEFLEEHNINHRKIKTLSDFKKLPLTSKETYVLKYDMKKRVIDSRFDDIFSIERSSGYSGIPIYWPRLPEEDELTRRHFEFGLVYHAELKKHKTLFIVCFAMGTWPSGEKVSRLIREIAKKKKYVLTVMNPGPNIPETLEIIEKMGAFYEHIIVAGYPPFLKNLIEEGEKNNLDFSKHKITLVGGGEDNTENWRDYLAQKLSIEIEKPGIPKIYSNYGAVDVGLGTALESPLSVLIRRTASKNKELCKRLFGMEHVPMLFQYNPLLHYIEEENGEVLITCYNSTPVVRYNIKDRGGSIPYKKMIDTLKEFNIDILNILETKGFNRSSVFHLPFFYVYGRSDGTIIFRGANIYVENIQDAFSDKRIIHLHTGNFRVKKIFDMNEDPNLLFEIELKEDIQESEELKEKIREVIVEILQKKNSEFKDAISHINYRVGVVNFFKKEKQKGIKHRYYVS
jgi:phenylacetate-CoA ligase